MDGIDDTLIIVIRVQNIRRMRFVYKNYCKTLQKKKKILDTLRRKLHVLRNSSS